MQELKQAWRLFRKSPGFSAVIVLTLALGIGANTAVFSILYGTLLRPLPYKDPGRLINILDTSPREKELAKIFASYADFDEFSRHARTLERVAADTWAGRPNAVLTGRGPAKAYLTIPVTAEFFETLGVAAQRGRTFTRADLHGGCAVVLSDKFWRGPLGADPRIVGESLSLDDQSCTVLGIMPANFAVYPPETEIWTLILPNDPRLHSYFGVFMIARLRPGVGITQARDELTALHKAIHARDTNGEKEFTPLVTGLQDQFTWLAGRNLRRTLALLFAAVILVLAIACLNIASLLLGRSFQRKREFAIRFALGSGNVRLVRQLLLESALLSSAGGSLGILIAFGATRYFVHAQPVELPVGSHIAISFPALAFAAIVSLITALVFALAPAWAISREDLHAGLRAMGANAAPRRQRIFRILVAAEMALSVLLLAGAGLMMRSVLSFETAPLGFAREDIFVADGSLPRSYHDSGSRRSRFFDQLDRQLATLPGVASATVAGMLPPYDFGLGTVEIEGKPVPRDQQAHDVGDVAVSVDYFRLFEIPSFRGRFFTEHDRPDSEPVAVVNESFAREYFANQDPIGKKIRLGEEQQWLTIVGVVANEHRPNVYEEMKWVTHPAVYRPLVQHPPNYFAVAVRTTGAQGGIGHLMEKAVGSIDADAALSDIKPMESRLAPYLHYPRFRATFLAAFSLLATMLAAIGLYAVLAQFVAERTPEIGVRMAVGAGDGDIARWIAFEGGVPACAGLVLGFALSFALTRYLRSLLYGVTATDAWTFAAVSIVMLAAIVFAMLLPARRALRVDPMTALRSE